jgi:hypothetical protein
MVIQFRSALENAAFLAAKSLLFSFSPTQVTLSIEDLHWINDMDVIRVKAASGTRFHDQC